ncbi:DNA methyltransferase, partial [Methanoculleus sp.]|uniref:DNA-methyltransferase n=1 Tax=Methanoculleus sp. TaxID=90427 RepID=UPI0025EB1798
MAWCELMERNKIYHGNNIDILRTFPDNSIDSIVTDPPYGLGKEPDALEVLQSWITTGYHEIKGKGFMGKEWDSFVPQPIFWKECYRVLKHGGHLLSFAGTRTYDWVVIGLRIAGFEIRDQIAWVYGSGFPKSLDIAKSIEGKLVHGSSNTKDFHKLDGREIDTKIGFAKNQFEQGARPNDYTDRHKSKTDINYTTDQAKQWQGWGTALKPALEPIVMARKPLDGTVANNVLKHGVGGINIDGCRVEAEPELAKNWERNQSQSAKEGGKSMNGGLDTIDLRSYTPTGRFPANIIHDGSEEVLKLFPNTGGGDGIPYDYAGNEYDNKNTSMFNGDKPQAPSNYNDSGSAARFFYTAKASQNERNFGLYGFEEKQSIRTNAPRKNEDIKNPARKNIHPTVKPIDLMRYLVRLVTPKGGICLDPFMGSGTTAIACKSEKINYVGCELEEDYIKIAEARIKAEVVQFDIFDFMED